MNHNQHKRLAIASLCAIVAMSSSAQTQSTAHQHQGAATASPYAGEQSRDIKALSSTETNNLLNGAGMGYAKAAELNGYPGPMHVLELARPLGLTDAQRVALLAIDDPHAARVISFESGSAAGAAFDHLRELGVAPEQARFVLPQSMMTTWVWKGSLLFFARVCRLRQDGHAQAEAQEIANMIAEHCARVAPVSWAALRG